MTNFFPPSDYLILGGAFVVTVAFIVVVALVAAVVVLHWLDKDLRD